ncbi:efflux RND transporter periplasmic adaptor subunit [Candidatus Uabimicrobium amorphum]|uniref:Peptidase M50 n=1 Tax=Uabimicrobium amorphum TaxID=2596890 RepID=A0A5S9IL22_UABAM|nr:efflux RND transporter periplasmic adaptor subunit [Candidatus Uabimicrobium amorphum]BBM83416.1 peptidase M50 [Candidatus Uabimicrobium amorphum]
MTEKSNVDFAIQEWMNLCPQLREDLKITFQKQKGEVSYTIEDPINSRYYRVGLLEYKFISLLNGKKKLSDLIITMVEDMQEQSFDNHEVLQILNWLNDSGLLQKGTPSNLQKDIFSSANEKASFLVFPKFPIGKPDKIISGLFPFFRPLLGNLFFCVWIITVLCGCYYIFSDWKTFVYGSNDILSVYSVISFALIWVMLKIVHELWHGLVCKLYGGDVREAGIMLLLLIPLGYVDTSSSWNFPSKWQRIYVSIAGMYIEVFIAAIAAIVWGETQSKVVQQICYNIIILGSITTLFFNINPLMRFDGYYVLMDLVEEPNLYTRSRNYIHYLCKRYILGVKVTTNTTIRQKPLFLVYGLLCFMWRILIYFGIFLASSIMLMGVGMIIAICVLLMWILIPTIKVLIFMFFGSKTEKPNVLRSLAVLGTVAAFCVVGYQNLTWQEKIQSPGVVVYKNYEIVRNYCPGFVKKIHINSGDYVKKGQILLILENREKHVALEKTKYDIAITENFIRRNQNDEEKRIQVQIAKEKLEYFHQTMSENKALVDSLTIKAPIDGYVFNEHLDSLYGKYIATGEELVEIFATDSAVFRAAILEDEIEQYAIKKGMDVTIYIVSLQMGFTGKINSVSPRADYEIKHPGITALAGGDLVVEQAAQGQNSQAKYRLAYPHFYLEVTIPKHYRKLLCNEQTGYIRIYREEKTVAELLYYKIKSKIQKFYASNL